MAAWVMTAERQPDQPGEYEICKDHGGPLKGYTWTGDHWETPAKVPTWKVFVWYDEKAVNNDNG
jgi:hypothetical protein